MKAIELTEEQRVKLTEMCWSLFPDNFKEDCGNIKNDRVFYLIRNERKILTPASSHWFEFSWQLLDEIITRLTDSPVEQINLIKEFGLVCHNGFKSINPVDYLYEQFKELK